MKRECGFYWIKFYDIWTIGEYVEMTNGELDWFVIGMSEHVDSIIIQEVGDKIDDSKYYGNKDNKQN